MITSTCFHHYLIFWCILNALNFYLYASRQLFLLLLLRRLWCFLLVLRSLGGWFVVRLLTVACSLVCWCSRCCMQLVLILRIFYQLLSGWSISLLFWRYWDRYRLIVERMVNFLLMKLLTGISVCCESFAGKIWVRSLSKRRISRIRYFFYFTAAQHIAWLAHTLLYLIDKRLILYNYIINTFQI